MRELDLNNLGVQEICTPEQSELTGGFLPMLAAAVIYIIGVETGWW